jgi:hypothetical protein
MPIQNFITIQCVNIEKGVIQDIGFLVPTNETHNNLPVLIPKYDSKENMISLYRAEKLKNPFLKIRTKDDIEVHIIKSKYLRTDGDSSKDNDLVDLPSCIGPADFL